MQSIATYGFGDAAVEKRKIKSVFLNQIDQVIDWTGVEVIINKHYSTGKSDTGRPSYPGLLLFKMSLLGTWYDLSDYELEEEVNDKISFSRFVGLSLDSVSPDHSVISRFRTELTKQNAYEELFSCINTQLSHHGVLVKTGAIVDASIIDTPRKPKGKTQYEVISDEEKASLGTEDANTSEEALTVTDSPMPEIAPLKTHTHLKKIKQPQVDPDAAWVKKGNRLRFGFKKHVVTNNDGLILGVLTTGANVHEITNLEDVLPTANLPKGIPIKADKGYDSKKNRSLLTELGFIDEIMHKGQRNRPLTETEISINKEISKTRYAIERSFGSIKRWFKSGLARYVGQAKMHTQNLMESIAYNLYRMPNIIILNAINKN